MLIPPSCHRRENVTFSRRYRQLAGLLFTATVIQVSRVWDVLGCLGEVWILYTKHSVTLQERLSIHDTLDDALKRITPPRKDSRMSESISGAACQMRTCADMAPLRR